MGRRGRIPAPLTKLRPQRHAEQSTRSSTRNAAILTRAAGRLPGGLAHGQAVSVVHWADAGGLGSRPAGRQYIGDTDAGNDSEAGCVLKSDGNRQLRQVAWKQVPQEDENEVVVVVKSWGRQGDRNCVRRDNPWFI